MGLRNKVRCLLIEARIKGDCCHSEAPWQTARMGVMKGPKLHRKTRYTRTGTLRKSATATTLPDDVILSGAKDLLFLGRSRANDMGAPFKPSFGGLSRVVRENLVRKHVLYARTLSF